MIDNQQQRVNLAELLEVRSNGLSASEILTILASSCENLIRAANRRGLFTIEQIFLSREGRIEIQLIQIGDTPKQWIPPELLEQSQPFGHDTSDSHLVWCLGKSCAQASAADHSDVALFSLLNLMTVDHLQSRPSLQKVRQMVRNRLNLVDFDRMPEIVVGLYREVLGDLDELINDPFGDDIRFSSQRSSQLSIIPGPGAPEHRERRDLEAYQQELTSEVESRLRRDFSLSRKHQMAKDLPLDEVIDIPDKFHVQHQKPVPSPRRGLSPAAVDLKKEEEEETEVEEELTPRGPSPMEEIGEGGKARAEEDREEFVPLGSQEVDQLLGTSKTEWQRFGDTPREEDTQKEQKQHQLHHPGNPFDYPDEEEADEVANVPTALESQKSPTEVANSRPNAESIQVEVHTPSQPIASSQSSTSVLPSHHPHPPHPQHGSESSTAESTSKSPSPHPKTTRLYAKATHGAASKPSRGVAAKKTPEIEVLHSDEGKMKNDAKKEAETKWEPISLWEADGEAPGVTTTFPAEEVDSIEHASYQKVQPVKVEAQPQQFQRQNSLQPARCSRRASTGGAARRRPEARHVGGGLPAVPEFLSNSTQPSIRLRAQSMKRKKVIALHRAEPAVVFVRLLNGHTVEVNCKSDQLVGAIFHTVAEHLNITEHLFFGLVLQQQPGGEFIFLEEEHRLEKWAPPGWKNSGGGSSGQRRSLGIADSASRSPFAAGGGADQFVIHLRFRYYPKKREFVKTATTAHQLYLQLRQDMLNGTLRFQPRENALEMAALALCVECGPPPATAGDYFKMENYLPSKFYELEPGEVLRVQREIGTLHTQLADQMGRLEAEERFIALCQSEPYYGAHFYRVHKMKPKRGQQPFLADMRLVAVMPSGIGICREERGASRRLFTSLHEWHHIRTLQFDRKRFLLGTVENGIAVDHVFYTDHHTKSAYLVRFAASQHRFMLKMRQWQGTLNRMRAMQRHKDVGVEVAERGIVGNDAGGQKKEEASEVHGREERMVEASLGQEGHRRLGSQPQMGLAGGGGGQRELLGDEGTAQTHQNRLLAETDSEYIALYPPFPHSISLGSYSTL